MRHTHPLRHLLIMTIFVLFVPATASMAQPALPPVVGTLLIEERDIVPATEYVGHVEALQTVDLRARVEGVIEETLFREGDLVRAGQTLFRIEQSNYRAQLAVEQARIAQATAEVARAESHLQRLRSVRRESISATDLDNAVAGEQTAKANLASARAAADMAQLHLDYTTIKAPISGRIGRATYTPGNLVNPAAGSLARIVQTTPVRVAYAISENDLAAVRSAMGDMDKQQGRLLAPHLRLSGGDLYPLEGRVVFVDNEIDQRTGTVTARAEFDNPDGFLLPGQYVTVLVKAAAPLLLPVVPQSAVLVNQHGRYVLTVRDGVAVEQPITTGPSIDLMWAVEAGLAAGDQVIVSGLQKVQPGQQVTAIAASQEN